MLENLREKLREIVAESGARWAEARVRIIAFLAVLLGVLELVDPYTLSYILPERWSALVHVGLGAAIFLLRKVVPPEEKDEE